MRVSRLWLVKPLLLLYCTVVSVVYLLVSYPVAKLQVIVVVPRVPVVAFYFILVLGTKSGSCRDMYIMVYTVRLFIEERALPRMSSGVCELLKTITVYIYYDHHIYICKINICVGVLV